MAQDNLHSQSDPELQFKKRARRRLVGAIALVLLLIIVLPMVLQDRTAQMPKQEVVVSIPSQDQALEAETTTAQDQQTEAIVEQGPVDVKSDAKASENEPSENQASTASSDKSQSVADTPKVQPAPKKEAKPQNKVAVTTSYFVQVGVFSDPANVKQMQDKLTTKSLQSLTELIDTAKGKKTRLRVGPFVDKKSAESALEKMKELNLAGMIVSGN